MSEVIATALRIVGFRATHKELTKLGRPHLALGLILTWLVGIGRWSGDPQASTLQHLGLGSVIYVFALSLFLWLIVWPLAGQGLSYLNVLALVMLTAPPGALYALPIRIWFDFADAQRVRMWFLAIVATWRVVLWYRYLRVGVQLRSGVALVGSFFPLTVIVVALWALNLERAVFDLMADISQGTVNDYAYGLLFLLSLLSAVVFVPLAIAYAILAIRGLRARITAGDRLGGPDPRSGLA